MTEDIAAKLEKKAKLSQTEQSVLEYLMEHTEEALKIGIRGVAQKKYTSTATVMRLAKKLGFEGFREMIYSFRTEMDPAGNTLPEELREQIHFIYDMQNWIFSSTSWRATGNAHSALSRICDTVFIIKDSHPFDPENLQSNYFFGYCILAFEEIFAIYHHQI